MGHVGYNPSSRPHPRPLPLPHTQTTAYNFFIVYREEEKQTKISVTGSAVVVSMCDPGHVVPIRVIACDVTAQTSHPDNQTKVYYNLRLFLFQC